ncbi:hypothetical protein AB1Y20_018048 [Prymnesium parvum]|uniref:Rab-GAP TBC domain-containing protein n=1 Tax=Prymnesium parvum TaxID=97485 RepID=A0AB34JQU5_PRYPA
MAFDAFGFPLDQEYIPRSQPAQLRTQHMLRWTRYWQHETRHGALPLRLRRTPQLRALVSAGIPIAFRGTLWPLLLDVPDRRAAAPPDYYRSLLARPVPPADGAAVDPIAAADQIAVVDQIKKDTERTWPRHQWLNGRALARVLTAWARHSPSVGYCQGLNTLAATLLLLMAEEMAFWCLVQLLETRIPHGYFGRTLWRCHAEIEVFKVLLSRRHPRVLPLLERGGLSVELFTTQWMVCLFASDLPLETAMRVWDLLCFSHKPPPLDAATRESDGGCTGDGLALLLAASLALFGSARAQLEAATDPARMSAALAAAVAATQPGACGERFLKELHAELQWVRESMPLRELRAVACDKVRARLRLVQALREGGDARRGREELRATHDDTAAAERVMRRRRRLRVLRLAREVEEGRRTLARRAREMVGTGSAELARARGTSGLLRAPRQGERMRSMSTPAGWRGGGGGGGEVLPPAEPPLGTAEVRTTIWHRVARHRAFLFRRRAPLSPELLMSRGAMTSAACAQVDAARTRDEEAA